MNLMPPGKVKPCCSSRWEGVLNSIRPGRVCVRTPATFCEGTVRDTPNPSLARPILRSLSVFRKRFLRASSRPVINGARPGQQRWTLGSRLLNPETFAVLVTLSQSGKGLRRAEQSGPRIADQTCPGFPFSTGRERGVFRPIPTRAKTP